MKSYLVIAYDQAALDCVCLPTIQRKSAKEILSLFEENARGLYRIYDDTRTGELVGQIGPGGDFGMEVFEMESID